MGFSSWNQARSLCEQAGNGCIQRGCFQAGVVGEMSKLLDIVGEMSKDWFHEFLAQASLAVIT